MGRWVTGPASTLRRSACPRYSWTVRADSAWSSIGLEAAPSTQSMEPWRNIGCCAISESPHIQRETVQHRRAGGLHYLLTTEANPQPLLEQSLNVAPCCGEPRPRAFLTPEIAIRRT